MVNEIAPEGAEVSTRPANMLAGQRHFYQVGSPVGGMPKRRTLGDASWALVGQVGSGLMLLAGTRVITELVSPEVFGQVALMNGLVGLGVSVFAYPFVSAGIRLMPEATQAGQRGVLVSSLSRLTLRSLALALLFLFAGGGYYAYASKGDPWLFLIAGILLLATVNRELGVHLLIGERRQREASLWQTSDGLMRPILAIALVCWLGPQAAWILLGYSLASACANLFWPSVHGLNFFGASPATMAERRGMRRQILCYAWPLIPMELLSWFSSLGDRYVIGYLMTAADVGIYAAAYTLVNEAFNRSAVALLRTFQPVYFGHFSMGRHDEARRMLGIWFSSIVALGVAGVVLLTLLNTWVAALLLGPIFQNAALLMPVIGAGCALQALGTVIAQPLHAVKRTGRLLVARLVGATVAAISIPLMVHWQELMGAALAAPLYFGAEALMLGFIAKPWSKHMSRVS